MAEKKITAEENVISTSGEVGITTDGPANPESQSNQLVSDVNVEAKPMENTPPLPQDANQSTEKKPYSPAIEPASVEPPVSNDIQPMVAEESNSTHWVVIIVVLVLLIIALSGGAFFYLTQYKFTSTQPILSPQPDEIVSKNESGTEVDNQDAEMQNTSQSDEVSDIEKDLQNTNLDQLDKEVEEIDKQL